MDSLTTPLKSKFERVVVAGNYFGILQTLRVLPPHLIECVIVASIRPEVQAEVAKVAYSLDFKMLVQPKFRTKAYNEFVKDFGKLDLDLLICNNYSMIIRPDLLSMLNGNAVNVHWSMLPENRGCNPLQWAIIKGQSSSGISLHCVDNGIDTGDIIAQEVVSIEKCDTWVTLKKRYESISDSFVARNLPLFLSGVTHRVKQTSGSVNQRLSPEFPKIDFGTMDNRTIYNLIRAQVAPLSGAYVENHGKRTYFIDFVEFERIEELRHRYCN